MCAAVRYLYVILLMCRLYYVYAHLTSSHSIKSTEINPSQIACEIKFGWIVD